MAWARAIARNVVLDHWKRKRRRQTASLDEAAFEQVSQVFADTDASVWAERRAALTQCIKALPPRNRGLLDRHYHQGFSIKALASTVRQTSGSVYVKLHRIRVGLLRCVEKRLGMLKLS
jgi:RNA polymerase sigma-70 factor (ECF subfamily)